MPGKGNDFPLKKLGALRDLLLNVKRENAIGFLFPQE
jgi:hypothetical protein